MGVHDWQSLACLKLSHAFATSEWILFSLPGLHCSESTSCSLPTVPNFRGSMAAMSASKACRGHNSTGLVASVSRSVRHVALRIHCGAPAPCASPSLFSVSSAPSPLDAVCDCRLRCVDRYHPKHATSFLNCISVFIPDIPTYSRLTPWPGRRYNPARYKDFS